MMTDENNGGPAFPIEKTSTPYAPGMTKREVFAIEALAAIIANPNNKGTMSLATMAQDACLFADALLWALEARK